MCVIMCFEDEVKPTLQMLKNGEESNPHGGGIAWISKKEGVIEYRKGLTARQINNLIKKENIQQPYIVHFRIDSVGNKSPLLNHPFPITDKDNPVETLTLAGKAKAVLFHNGHWIGWEDRFLNQVINANIYVGDNEEWSDSRTMAMLASIHGLSVLKAIGGFNKISVLTLKGIKRFGDGWTEVNGATCSNDYFENTTNTVTIVSNEDIDKEFVKLKTEIKAKGKILQKLAEELKKCSNEKHKRRIKRKIDRLEKSVLELRNKQEDLFQNSSLAIDDLDFYEKEYKKQEEQAKEKQADFYSQHQFMYE